VVRCSTRTFNGASTDAGVRQVNGSGFGEGLEVTAAARRQDADSSDSVTSALAAPTSSHAHTLSAVPLKCIAQNPRLLTRWTDRLSDPGCRSVGTGSDPKTLSISSQPAHTKENALMNGADCALLIESVQAPLIRAEGGTG
jgi:hypothetical protein